MSNNDFYEESVDFVGGARKVKFDLLALANLERIRGKSMQEIFDPENMKRVGAEALIALFLVGLRCGGMKDATEEKIARMIPLGKLGYYSEKVGEILNRTMSAGEKAAQALEDESADPPELQSVGVGTGIS